MSYLLAFEGIDGSGKSTLAKSVVEKLNGILFRFPTHNGAVGKLIRRVFSGEETVDPAVMAFLMAADQIDTEKDVRAALHTGRSVIMDRHTMVSAWAYQTEIWPVNAVMHLVTSEGFVRPDVIFIVDVPTDIAIGRIQGRGGKDGYYENVDRAAMEQRRNRYIAYQLMHPGNTVLLNGLLSPEELVTTVMTVLTQIEGLRTKRN